MEDMEKDAMEMAAEVTQAAEVSEMPAEGPVAEAENVSEAAINAEEQAEAEEESVDIEALIAEAEARGYERGRNEGIEAWMNDGRRGRAAVPAGAPESEVMILNNLRRSVWE